ncbi:uncharacterized protein DEA37_0006866, partial [Paragonimus westermani]
MIVFGYICLHSVLSELFYESVASFSVTAILYGLLATTVTNLAALGGLVFAPLHKCSGYSTLMSFMIATAVGSLFTTAVMVLIPEAFRLSEFHVTSRDSNWYVPTSLSICAGAFLFFVLEFALRRMRLFLEVSNHPPVVLYCEWLS